MANPAPKSGRPGPPPGSRAKPGDSAQKGASVKSQAEDTADTQFEAAKNERRVRDIGSARSLFVRMQTDNELRFATIRNTRNQLEGGRPFDPNVLDQQGASWQTNINFGDAQSQRDRTLLPYWKMVHDVPHAITCRIETPTPKADTYSLAFAECFDLFLSDWGTEYQTEYMNMANNFVNFGPGIVQWADLEDPRWASVNVQRVVWPKNTRMPTKQWDMVALVRDCSPAELYAKVRTKRAREVHQSAGWNIKAVESAIAYFKDGTFAPDPRDYTRWQDLFVNNDLAVATPLQPLQLVWLFVRQFSEDGKGQGKVGCYVFTQQGGVEDFLFSDEDFCEDFGETLRCVWYDTGVDSMVHSVKGFAIKNYYFALLANRMKSRFVDASIFSFGINFQRTNDNIPDEAPPIENYGPVTVFPPGLTQLTVYPQVQQCESVIEMLENNAAQTNALYREQTQQIQETDTATQAKLLAGIQGATSEASASIYLAQVGDIFAECMRKLRKRGNSNPDAKKFVARMRERGIPDKVIFDAEITVKTGANATMANPVLRAAKYQQMLGLINIPGVNVRWILENYFANELGSQNQALLPEGENSAPLQRREAMMENQMFGQGQPLPVAPSDAHAEHAEEHLTPLEGIVGMFQKQGTLNPEQAVALTLGTEHTGEHMGYLAQDKTQDAAFQALNPRFRMVQSAARGILTRLSKAPNTPNAPQPVAQLAPTG